MAFEQMRCEECGRATAVLVDEQYLAGSPSKAAWAKRMEARAGKCRCGGQYTLQAKPRCPKCRSVDLDKGNVEVLYD